MARARFVLRGLAKRALHDRLVLLATALIVLCALVVVAAGPIYASTVSSATLRRGLVEMDPAATSVQVSMRTPVAEYERVATAIEPVLQRMTSGLGGEIVARSVSDSYGLPHRDDWLTELQWVPQLDQRAVLSEGAWPAASVAGAPLEVVLGDRAADRLGLGVGDQIELSERREGANALEVVVVGRFVLDGAPLTMGPDQLTRTGIIEGTSFTTVGPFFVGSPDLGLDGDTFHAAEWWVAPDLAAIDETRVGSLRSRVASLERDVGEAIAAALGDDADRVSAVEVETGLVDALADADRSLEVTRANVVAVLIQVALMAGFAIALTAELVASTRAAETTLTHSRGAGQGPVVIAAALEALVMVVPLAIVAPWLAAAAVNLLDTAGPIASIDLALDPQPTLASWLVVAVAAVAAIGFLVLPSARAVGVIGGGESGRGRSGSRSRFQKAGVDLALLVVALVAIWQLRQLGSRRTQSSDGTFGIDPLLLVAPAVATLAGGVLTLRVVPLLARAGERLATRGRSATVALAAWQIARRPRRHTRAALLLVIAVAIGFFATTYTATWFRSQDRQARHQVGADVRVQPNRQVGAEVSDLHLLTAVEAVDDVRTAMLVERRVGGLPAADRPAHLLLIDGTIGADIVSWTDTSAAVSEGWQQMTAARPVVTGVRIEGEVEQLAVTVAATEAPVVVQDDVVLDPAFDAHLDLMVVDGRGALHRLAGGRIDADVGDLSLTYALGSSTGPVVGPLTIIAFEIRSVTSQPLRSVTVEIGGLQARRQGQWEPVVLDAANGGWRLASTQGPAFLRPPRMSHASNEPDGVLGFELELGTAFRPQLVTFSAEATGWSAPEAIPVFATDDWMAASNTEVGDIVSAEGLRGEASRLQIVGRVADVPTVDPSVAMGILADRATVQLAEYTPGTPIRGLVEVWLNLELGADVAAVERTLSSPPLSAFEVSSIAGREDDLTSDPLALGTGGALALGFVAATVVAAVGFAVSAGVSARERGTEIALLRALGLSGRGLTRWLAVEQGVIVVLSLALGTLVGWLLSTAVLPLTSLTQQGEPVVPEVMVVFPWRTILALDLAVLATLALTVVVMTLGLRRLGLGQRLRLGDDG